MTIAAVTFPETKEPPSLTDEEKACLEHLRDAWNLFGNLKNAWPPDLAQFRDSIIHAQDMIALRIARRVNPEVWV